MEAADVEIRPDRCFPCAAHGTGAGARLAHPAGHRRPGRGLPGHPGRRDVPGLGGARLRVPSNYVEKERIAERWRAADGSQRELVAELRAAGLSQAAAGAAVGITQARVSQLERGKTGNETRRSRNHKSTSGSPFNRSSAGQGPPSDRTNGHFGAMTSANVGYLPPAGPLRWRAQSLLMQVRAGPAARGRPPDSPGTARRRPAPPRRRTRRTRRPRRPPRCPSRRPPLLHPLLTARALRRPQGRRPPPTPTAR